MKSICFFPFTRMTSEQATTMDGFFGKFKILALDPSQFSQPYYFDLINSGRLETVTVPEEAMRRLDGQVRAFKEWAAIHKGNEKNLKALIREKTWLKDENGVAAIQSQIRTGGAMPMAEEQSPEGDPLLVLKFAEILDMENETIRQSLNTLEENKAALFAELKGELRKTDMHGMDNGDIGTKADDDPASNMTPGQIKDRIKAWCAAAMDAGCFNLSPAQGMDKDGGCAVVATTSPAVVEYLFDNSEGMINGLDIDSIKVHEHDCDQREAWFDFVEHALGEIISGRSITAWPEQNQEAACHCPTGQIRVWAFPSGELNKAFNIPGTQVVVCLVKLNS